MICTLRAIKITRRLRTEVVPIAQAHQRGQLELRDDSTSTANSDKIALQTVYLLMTAYHISSYALLSPLRYSSPSTPPSTSRSMMSLANGRRSRRMSEGILFEEGKVLLCGRGYTTRLGR